MKEMETRIRQMAKDLLAQKKVDQVVGFCQGSLAAVTRPFLARNPKEADQLVFNCNCRMNLATFVPGLKGRTGIVAKGCDSRNLVIQMTENRVNRKDLYIIGVPCSGMADKNKLRAAAGGWDLIRVNDRGEQIEVETTQGTTHTLSRQDLLQDNCVTCIRHNPVIYDALAGPEVPEPDLPDRFADVVAVQKMDPGEKQAYFQHLLKDCIRCYACRDACPLCYCPTCFVDESSPQWVGKTPDPVDVTTYHLVRAFHDAGRCTDCGACEAACPMNIRVRSFTRKTIMDCVNHFGEEAGLNPNQRPVLDRFQVNDPNDFFR
ncbi:4Fe-4S binding protein [Desulfotignum balticum]|jgi:ferredoxin|uniref:4Fe-4S binding protein n=1 Tax=Desulfotignum balticum TaxID=115781 RepID=UPI00040B6AD7|nr:4Fe-4S binding protein [Desulfotignum balticum]